MPGLQVNLAKSNHIDTNSGSYGGCSSNSSSSSSNSNSNSNNISIMEVARQLRIDCFVSYLTYNQQLIIITII